jgi:hypothetical protein
MCDLRGVLARGFQELLVLCRTQKKVDKKSGKQRKIEGAALAF